jgi:hypothetical protein
MKSTISKKIIRIEREDPDDIDGGLVRVFIEVPKFQNFGQRLGELERKAWDADLSDPVDMSKGFDLMSNAFQKVFSGKAKMDKAQKKFDALDAKMGGKLGSLLEKVNQQLLDATADLERELEKPDEEKPRKLKPPKFEHNLQRLRVELAVGTKWDKTTEARIDRFLADWPNIRPAVLESTFKFYKKIYPQAVRPHRHNPGTKFTMPEPTAPEVVADLFHVTSIHLHDKNDTIGITGGCTWDLEHVWGALLRKNKVVKVGGWDAAN